LKGEINQKIKRMTKYKNFVFANPLLPFGTVRESHTHCTHLQITLTNPLTKFAKECNYQPTEKEQYGL